MTATGAGSTHGPRPTALRSVLAIVGVELRRVVRDRTGLFFIVVLPFIVILLFGAGGAQDGSLNVGVVGAEGDEFSELPTALAAQGFHVREFSDAGDVARAVRRGDLVGGVVAQTTGAAATSELRWVGDPGSAQAPGARLAVQGVVDQLDARLVARRVVAEELGAAPDALAAAAGEARTGQLLEVAETRVGEPGFSFGVDESSQHNLVLFVFITSLTGGAALIESRRLGTARRTLASPASAGTVLAGTAAARFAIALGQALLVLVGASLLFGAQWGDPIAVAATVTLLCLCGTGASMLFGSVLSNAQQATAIAPPLGIALGMLGGALWPLEIVPEAMQTVGRAVPHSWAIDALREVGSRGGGLGDIVGALTVLAAFAAVLLGLATWRLGISLRRAT